MNDPDPSAAMPSPAQRPWKRRLAWYGVAMLLPVAALAAIYGYGYLTARERLRDAIEEADRLDPGWRLEDLEARRAVVPDGENAALQVTVTNRLLPANWPSYKANQRAHNLRAPVQLTAAEIALFQAALANAAEARVEARQLAYLSRGRWPPITVATRPPAFDALAVAKLLLLDAVLLAQEGDADSALRSCLGALNAGRSFGDEPSLFSQLMRRVCQVMAVVGIQRTLTQGEPTEAALADAQERLRQEEAEPLLLYALRGERAGWHHGMQTGEVSLRDYYIRSFNSPTLQGSRLEQLELVWPGAGLKYHAAFLALSNQMVEIAKTPVEGHAAQMKELGAALAGESILVRQRLEGLRRMVMDDYERSHADQRCTITALAAERYRRKYGRWPEGLSALVPEFLPAVPLDPFDGAPIRLLRTGDGLVIYSVGEDRQDNGGVVYGKDYTTSGPDLGLRLWDPDKRRQPAKK